MSDDETWFEVKIDRDLARLFQRIVNVHSRVGRAKRAELIARLADAIADPASGQPVPDRSDGGDAPGAPRLAAGAAAAWQATAVGPLAAPDWYAPGVAAGTVIPASFSVTPPEPGGSSAP